MAEILREPEYVSNQIAEFGPVLTDEEFFEELDTEIPELREAAEAFFAKDMVGAYKKFTDYIKAISRPEIFFSIGSTPEKPVFDEALKEKAELAMKHYFVSVGIPMQFGEEIDWLANPTPNNYSEWRIQLQRHAELITLARAYRASGDERYAEELVKLMLHWVKHVPRCEYTSGSYGPTQTWRTLECGGRCNSWTEMVHSVKDSPYFTDEACVTIYKSLYEHQMRLAAGYTHGNWLFIELNGMAMMTAVTPIFKKSKEWREDVERRLMEALETMVYPDGLQYELAPGYMAGCLGDSRAVETTFRAYGYRLPDKFYEIINSMVGSFVKMLMANGKIPPINDSSSWPCKSYIGGAVRTYGGDDAAKWAVSGGEDGKEPPFKSVILPYGGFVALRTGWGKEDISAFFDAGKYGRDHFHDDKLNLLIYNSEKPVITECGNYAYDVSKMRNYCVNTEGHNTVMVDGYGQCRFEGHWGNPENWAHTKEEVYLVEEENLDYAWGVYREIYGVYDYSKLKRPAVPGRKLAEHVREVVLMKRPAVGKPYFIAVDTMTDKIGADSHTYEALWHVNAEDVTICDNVAYNDDVTIITCGLDGLTCVKGQEEPFMGWLSDGSGKQGAYYAAPTVIGKTVGKNTQSATLFYLSRREECPVESISLCDGKLSVTYGDGQCDTVDLSRLSAKAKALGN